ncbi:MAG: hypothetical protein HYS80_00880, partial [Candidatus Aenigmarchaeota archaeon]|nr:hypothetical protein [Candidatus Aenigmarchaeota archaeon]
GTKIAFRLQSQEDIKIIAEAAGFMDYTEFEYLSDRFVRLPRKTAIVCTSGHEPFLMTTANFELEGFLPETKPEEEATYEQKEDPQEKVFLESIEKEPFLSVVERRTKLGWSDVTYTKIVDELLRKRKIERVKVKLGRGSPKILYQRPGSIPSVKHQYYVNWIAESLTKKGYHVKKNKDGADIEVSDIAVEVEIGTSNISGNLKRDLQKFSKVIVCSDDSKLIETLSAQMKDIRILFLPVQKVPASFEKMQAAKDLVNS